MFPQRNISPLWAGREMGGKVGRTLNPHKTRKKETLIPAKIGRNAQTGEAAVQILTNWPLIFLGGRKEEMLYRPPRISYASFAPSTATRKLFPLFLFAVEFRLMTYPHFPVCNVCADFFFFLFRRP